jgi:hypothetical protein
MCNFTDKDIESPEDSADTALKYATPEEWFADIKSRYTHCIEIPLMRDCQ